MFDGNKAVSSDNISRILRDWFEKDLVVNYYVHYLQAARNDDQDMCLVGTV